MKYAAAIFDLGGTLVPYWSDKDFEGSLAGTADILGCSCEDMSRLWCTKENFVSAVTGKTSSRSRIEMTCDRLGIAITEELIEAALESRIQVHREWLAPFPSALETLKTLGDSGMRLGLMSVCSDEVPAIWDETAFARHFDAALFSCELGWMKSEPKFFLEACRRLDVSLDSTMYVGDTEEELLTAASVGMTPVLMRTGKDIRWNGKAVGRPIDVLKLAEMASSDS